MKDLLSLVQWLRKKENEGRASFILLVSHSFLLLLFGSATGDGRLSPWL